MARDRRHPLENILQTILTITNCMQSKWNLEPRLKIVNHCMKILERMMPVSKVPSVDNIKL
jgi:hypothetical protein